MLQQNAEERRTDGLLPRRPLPYDRDCTAVRYCTDGLLPGRGRDADGHQVKYKAPPFTGWTQTNTQTQYTCHILTLGE